MNNILNNNALYPAKPASGQLSERNKIKSLKNQIKQ